MNYKSDIIFKKNIILIPADYDGVSNQKGILTLNFGSDKVEGTIRCYNLKPTNENFVIGVQVGEAIFKTKATATELSNLKVQIQTKANNASKISCAIVNLKQSSYETLLWGSTETTKAIQNHILIQNMLEKTNIINSQQQNKTNYVVNSYNQQLEDKQTEIFEDELLESYIDKVVAETETEQEFSKQSKYIESDRFFNQVEGQIDLLFEKNEPDELLEKIIPDSKFCKVKNGNDFYVFGVIYEDGKEKCICYGVPSEYSSVPPKEMEGFCQWLPLDANDYTGKGYFMTYQDASTGENIAVEVI